MRLKPVLGYLLYLIGWGIVLVVALGLAIVDAARRLARR